MATRRKAADSPDLEEVLQQEEALSVPERAVLVLLKHAFPHEAIHFAWEKVIELAGDDTEAGKYLSGLASLVEQEHNVAAH